VPIRAEKMSAGDLSGGNAFSDVTFIFVFSLFLFLSLPTLNCSLVAAILVCAVTWPFCQHKLLLDICINLMHIIRVQFRVLLVHAPRFITVDNASLLMQDQDVLALSQYLFSRDLSVWKHKFRTLTIMVNVTQSALQDNYRFTFASIATQIVSANWYNSDDGCCHII
jgi:hypothetical protein